MSDSGFAKTAQRPAEGHAVDELVRRIMDAPGEITLIAQAPLTNIALALRLDPTLPQRVARIVVMGGAVTGHGNITPAAEFNFYFDPEAAHIVFEAFPHIELADWEATIAHGLLHDRVVEWLGADSPLAGTVRGQGTSWAHPEARVATRTVEGPVYFGRGATVAEGAHVGPGVSVGAGAKVGAGARVQRAAVFEDTEVAPGETLTEVLAWDTHRIAAPLTGR